MLGKLSCNLFERFLTFDVRWGLTIRERNQMLTKQGNCCSLCGDAFLFDPEPSSSQFHIHNAIVEHEHRVERDKAWGATLKEQKKAGIRGLAHGVCNTSVGRLEKVLDYDALVVAAKLERMALSLRRYDRHWREGNLTLARIRDGDDSETE